MKYSEVAKRLRLPLGFILGITYLIFARPMPLTLAVGAAIAFIGVLVRAWASGHISKNERLATSGPYAHTRNPLYFGSFLIAAGFAIAAHWALLLLVVAFFVLIYAPTMQRERANIAGRFPDAYEAYAARIERSLAATHRRAPLRAGASREEIRSSIDLGAKRFNAMVERLSSGKLRISPSRFLAKTVEPAPMKATFTRLRIA